MGGVYSNFMMDTGPAQARAAYGSSYDRLARIKRAYDPDNIFHVNQNIAPAKEWRRRRPKVGLRNRLS
jgi:hypothetical protein